MVAVLLLGSITSLAFIPVVGAQDATPSADQPVEILPGVTMDSVVMADDQSGPTSFRLHIDAGASFPIDPGGGLELVVVEAGTLIVHLNGSIIAGEIGATSPASETVAADTDVSLSAGHFFVLPSAVAGELRNEGDEPVTILVAEVPTAIAATPVIATPAA
jgi:hypothetical protein